MAMNSFYLSYISTFTISSYMLLYICDDGKLIRVQSDSKRITGLWFRCDVNLAKQVLIRLSRTNLNFQLAKKWGDILKKISYKPQKKSYVFSYFMTSNTIFKKNEIISQKKSVAAVHVLYMSF